MRAPQSPGCVGFGGGSLCKGVVMGIHHWAFAQQGKAQESTWSPAQAGRGAQPWPQLSPAPGSIRHSHAMELAHKMGVKNLVCCALSTRADKAESKGDA